MIIIEHAQNTIEHSGSKKRHNLVPRSIARASCVVYTRVGESVRDFFLSFRAGPLVFTAVLERRGSFILAGQ